jgi:Cu-Zn family superoxide dismutase
MGHCRLLPTQKYGVPLDVRGHVRFHMVYSDDGDSQKSVMRVVVDIKGLLGNGEYAIHVHEYGDLTDLEEGLNTGEHFIGTGSSRHNCPPSAQRHEGDMGNWKASGGQINLAKDFDLLKLTGKNASVLGRAVILHAKADNCTGTNGFAGSRLAQCVIGLRNEDNNMAEFVDPIDKAVAVLQPTKHCDENCGGAVYFFQMGNTVEVIAMVRGLEYNTEHGFHIHQYGDISGNDGLSAGEHYNPNGRHHHLPPMLPRHLGDLGNIQSYSPSTGLAWYRYIDPNLRNLNQLIGRAVVVHEDADHGSGKYCDEGGSSGGRLMIGVIGVAHPETKAPTVPDDVVIDNEYENRECEGFGEDKHERRGLIAGLVIGWSIVGFLLLIVVPGIIIFYHRRVKRGYSQV